MKLRHVFSKSLLLATLFIVACGPDDTSVDEVELVDYAEQVITDDALLQEYLQTHTYNYDDFSGAERYSGAIVLDTLAGDDANKTPLIDLVQSIEVPVDAEGEIVQHRLYHLVAQQGNRVSNKPTIVDSVYLAYKGKLLDGTVFDENEFPIWFDLASVIPGFRYGLQHFAPGSYTVENNGTFAFENYGQGILFMPSGLGYYNQARGSIPAYSPLIFEVAVYTTNITDHDADGILSINEDPDGDGNPYNDDTDGNGITNMFDPDDDGDGVLTSLEYDVDEDGQPDDDDNDGIPNYLDPDNN